jgi:hypothetical protein
MEVFLAPGFDFWGDEVKMLFLNPDPEAGFFSSFILLTDGLVDCLLLLDF